MEWRPAPWQSAERKRSRRNDQEEPDDRRHNVRRGVQGGRLFGCTKAVVMKPRSAERLKAWMLAFALSLWLVMAVMTE